MNDRYRVFKMTEGALQMAAMMGRSVTYGELGKILKPYGGWAGSGVMNRALYDLVVEDHLQKRPFHSTLVGASSNGLPSEGLFTAFDDIGFDLPGDPFERMRYALQERSKCFKYWSEK